VGCRREVARVGALEFSVGGNERAPLETLLTV
jgi:hypothetical protein